MKRCPKCNRTFPTDTQRFCTHDGGLLELAEPIPPEPISNDTEETDAPTKVISRDLVPSGSTFDPFKTTIGTPAEREKTSEIRGAVTSGFPGQPPPVSDQSPAPPSGSPSGTLPGTTPTPPTESAGASMPVTVILPPQPEPLSTLALPPPPPAPPPASTPSSSGNLAPAGSGPITSPPSGSLPPPQFTQQPGAAQPVRHLAAPPPKKKSKLPLILGILAVLFILGAGGIVVAYIFAIKPMLANRNGVIRVPSPHPLPSQAPPTSSPAASPSPSVEAGPLPYEPPADAVQFVNSNKDLDGKLAEHYVDFSFYYPERWQKDPKSGVAGANNFIEVHRSLPGDFTQESLAISWYDSAGSFKDDQDLFPSYVEKKSEQFEKSISQYHKLSEGPTKIATYEAYEFRFEGMSQDPKKGELKIWGRVIWLPAQERGKSGITLLMFGTSLATELKSVDDVGVKGELPMLLESFRFGPPASQ